MTPEQKAALWREELLNRLSPSVRPRIEHNANYEDIVALLSAWMQATDEHLNTTEERVVKRLSSELAPEGEWKFPVQTLGIPVDLTTRVIDEETSFRGDSADDQWRACGAGWTRPTSLLSWNIEYGASNAIVLVCAIHSDKPDMRLLLPETEKEPKDGQQLAFVCGDDDLVEALIHSPWAVRHSGERTWQAVTVTRYQDYLRMERGLGGARLRQRQLSAWVPPFYPYSRNFVRFALAEPDTAITEADWEFIPSKTGVIQLAAKIDRTTAKKLGSLKSEASEEARSLFLLNAVPLAQMQSRAEDLLGSPFQTPDGYAQPVTGVWGTFAATVRETYSRSNEAHVVYPGAGLQVKSAGFASRRADEQETLITCAPPSRAAQEYQARLYFGSRGEDTLSPSKLLRGQQTFRTPFPALGGKNASVMEYGDAGARHAWYQTFVRAPQPSAADILEILSQIPVCRDYLVLEKRSWDRPSSEQMIQMDIDNRPPAQRGNWENYLWPTLVSEDTLLEMRASFLSKSEVAIMPRMRLHFDRRKQELPDFLWRELERYIASVFSQYFMIGWYRVEGVVRDA